MFVPSFKYLFSPYFPKFCWSYQAVWTWLVQCKHSLGWRLKGERVIRGTEGRSQNKDSKKGAQIVTQLKSCPSTTVPIQASTNSVTLTETQSLSTVFISSTVQPLTKNIEKVRELKGFHIILFSISGSQVLMCLRITKGRPQRFWFHEVRAETQESNILKSTPHLQKFKLMEKST